MAGLSLITRKHARNVLLVRYQWRGGPSIRSPLDLWLRRNRCRRIHKRFFTPVGKHVEWRSGAVMAAFNQCLTGLGVAFPPFEKYTSHFLRIGSHTEHIFLGIPLDVGIKCFCWGLNSQEMAVFYFDRTIETSNALFWLFGRLGSGHPAQATASVPVA